jgi:hypothetical protein
MKWPHKAVTSPKPDNRHGFIEIHASKSGCISRHYSRGPHPKGCGAVPERVLSPVLCSHFCYLTGLQENPRENMNHIKPQERSRIDRVLHPDPISKRTWAITAWITGIWALIRLSDDLLTILLLAVLWTAILEFLNPHENKA